MRRRQVTSQEEDEPIESFASQTTRLLKNLDLYEKQETEHTVSTSTGGTVSVVSLTIIFFLFISELWSYLSTTHSHSIAVDTRTAQKLPIYFNITFHSLRCSAVTIDIMDVSGDQQIDAFSHTYKTRLSPKGERIGAPFIETWEEEGEEDSMTPQQRQYQQQQMAILQMLQGAGMRPNMPLMPPPSSQGSKAHPDFAGEGCELGGWIEVNKVAGNVHIALGANHHSTHSHAGGKEQKHLHQFMIHEMLNFNASHTITSLTFGENLPTSTGVIQPLNGIKGIIQHGSGSAHYQYFVKVVPTMYTTTGGKVIDTNQYSVTTQVHPITPLDAYNPDGRKIPGVFFVYDLSPFVVKIQEKTMPLSTFLTSLCAIVGGVFTIAGIVDSILFHTNRKQ